MPVQEDVVETVEEKLHGGEYESHEQLIEDLKTDATLFVSALRQLGTTHTPPGSQVANDGFALYSTEGKRFSPSELLQSTPMQDIGAIISDTRRLSAHHSYTSITDFQAAQLEEAMVATIASEALAFSMGVDPHLAYTCGLLRQLGHSLAAWNYPDEFKSAFFLENGDDLDTRLTGLLGFSPNAMGKMMVRDWNLEQSVLEAISSEATRAHIGSDWNLTNDDEVKLTMSKICEVGEVLGKIVHMQYHPNAKKDWNAVQAVFESHLGLSGIELVLQEARERLLRCAPHNVTLPLPPILEALKKKIAQIEQQFKLLRRNTWLQFLPTEARIRLERFYRNANSNAILDGSFLSFLNEVLPYAGFARGCVYLPDAEGERLVPEFFFGAYSGSGPQAISLTSRLARFESAASAYTLKSMIHRTKKGPDGKAVLGIASAVSHVDPTVVLYLETRDDFLECFGDDPIPMFRALLQFFTDCLEGVNQSAV